jgi:lysophospholipase L1-like esterase
MPFFALSRIVCAAFSAALLLSAFARGDGPVIDSMDALSFRPPAGKAKVELVDGHEGKALRFSFDEGATSIFAIGKKPADATWNQAAGFSFYVKGDGSPNLGGLQFIWNEDYALRYDYAFPIDSTEWRKITVAWRDLIPVRAVDAAKPIDPAHGNLPSKLGPIWFGKWWYWHDYPASSYSIDELRLEPSIELDHTDYTPPAAPLARTLAKLKAGQPVTICTMGDSLTDLRHWANRTANWPGMLQARLKEKFGVAATMINPAIGGTQLPQGLVLLPRWSAREPDLVTILYGYNDWDAGTRGPQFLEGMGDAIDRVRRATHGKSDVLVITTCPALGRWDTMAELSEACRQAAKARHAGLAETEKKFHAVPEDKRPALYVNDKTHLAAPGHEIVAAAVLEAITSGGL